jgi:hypothetical protein
MLRDQATLAEYKICYTDMRKVACAGWVLSITHGKFKHILLKDHAKYVPFYHILYTEEIALFMMHSCNYTEYSVAHN